MAGNFEIKHEGAIELRNRIRGRADVTHHRLKRLTENSASAGGLVMKRLAPRGETLRLSERIFSSNAVFHPGGAGGGGFWEADFGVKDQFPRYPIYVYEGTGIFGLLYRPITAAPGNIMTFQIDGRTIHTRKVKGQRPQREWVDQSINTANEYIEKNLPLIFEDEGII